MKFYDYKKQKVKYDISLKKEINWYKKRNIQLNKTIPINDIFINFENLNEQDSIISDIEILDKNPMITFSEEFKIESEPDLSYQNCFLYHGLRFQHNLEKLEGILSKRKILAGIYLDNYSSYSDNCNDGEYVSLARFEKSIEFETFVGENICLIVSPLCRAYKTIYVPFDVWDYIKENNISLKNRYSYSKIEYQVKDFIPLELVRAIGIPYSNIRLKYGIEFVDNYIKDIVDLLNYYNIELPIVDINNCNKVIYSNCKRFSLKI